MTIFFRYFDYKYYVNEVFKIKLFYFSQYFIKEE